MIKYDVFNTFGTHRRVCLDSSVYSRAEYYDKNTKQWKQSLVPAVDLILWPHNVLVARNVVFKDSVCSQ
ncbi:hypothetical protein kpv48_06 [Klebsiella phage vB_KpnP_KpV48]|uniref:Uncharacterized protein n=1 Tax=Klebsiella phage vB_KpnP_KpV48 TaxID=1912319 RepID=A0A1I9SED7_9CAUD|nr:hypothetical protein HOR34_gp06 [Klebsiella phage vB_KpnP_KpV48]AOZ65214.1 hypothetical protein kpv48_06 [Klebsiella phage vB_KpnP_KpV48]